MFKLWGQTILNLRDPYIGRLILYSAFITFFTFLIFTLVTWYGLSWLSFSLSWISPKITTWFGTAAVMVASYFLFPLLFPIISTFFLDGLVTHLEKRHYPRTVSKEAFWTKSLIASLRFLGVAVGLNILVLPFYFIPFFNIGVYYGLNGYVLAREFFEIVALRHGSAAQSRALFYGHWKTLLPVGVFVALLATVPLLNLGVPVLATIFFVHVFHALKNR